MDSLSLINLISSLTSLILAVLSICLSLYFYNKSKDTETNVKIYLEEIKTQVATLERLTGKWMDRFTRYVTTPQPIDAMSEHLLEFIKQSSSQGNKQTGMTEPDEKETLMYKEEEKPQFVMTNPTKAKKGASK